MDFMIGTIDAKRLRKDLLSYYRKNKNLRSQTVRNEMYALEVANEQQLIAVAKKEGLDVRKYLR
ncbi:MAG: hypothetical protein IJ733_13995 [Lachnospiraceae bacterium]|nr:hypothetical protein [Lachnospiraceae bacterium]